MLATKTQFLYWLCSRVPDRSTTLSPVTAWATAQLPCDYVEQLAPTTRVVKRLVAGDLDRQNYTVEMHPHAPDDGIAGPDGRQRARHPRTTEVAEVLGVTQPRVSQAQSLANQPASTCTTCPVM